MHFLTGPARIWGWTEAREVEGTAETVADAGDTPAAAERRGPSWYWDCRRRRAAAAAAAAAARNKAARLALEVINVRNRIFRIRGAI